MPVEETRAERAAMEKSSAAASSGASATAYGTWRRLKAERGREGLKLRLERGGGPAQTRARLIEEPGAKKGLWRLDGPNLRPLESPRNKRMT